MQNKPLDYLFCSPTIILWLISSPTLFHDLAYSPVVFTLVLTKHPSSFRISRGVWIGVAQQRLNRGKYSCYIIDWAPLILQNVQANASISINIRVEHSRHKADCWWLIWIVLGELKSQLKRTWSTQKKISQNATHKLQGKFINKK